ncbi:methyl-accepting chemotaxis protein [Terrarubrum flagellatum]|uniref:methyl-accepting chemotaxis protein n=1 Tax=Terrirubrum flagellatum TaxID=2895980 RepID=UPI003144F305
MFFTSSIQRCIAATLALLVLPLALVAVWVISSALWDVAAARQSIKLAQADKTLLLAAAALRGQRGDVQTALLAEDDPRAMIARVMEDLGKRLAEGAAELRDTSLDARADLAKAIDDKWAAAATLFAGLNQEALKPKAERKAAAVAPWSNAIENVLNATLAASQQTGQGIRQISPKLAQLQNAKEDGWLLRANYGGQCSLMAGSFASNAAIAAPLARKLGELRGGAALSVASLTELAGNPYASAPMKAKASASVSAVTTATRQADELFEKLGAPGSIDATEWRKRCVQPYDAIISVMTTSLDEVVEDASQTFNWSLIKLAGAMVVALLVAGVGVASWIGLRDRISRPVVDIRSTLERLQAGKLDEPVAEARYPDEIGALSGALETYRENALALETARKEREALQDHQLAEAAASQVVVANVAEIVAGAKAGDFSGRADIGDVQGSVRQLAEGVNAINEVVDQATNELSEVLQSMAGGDLTRSIVSSHAGRFGELREAVNETIARLRGTLSAIQNSAVEVANASAEIATATTDLSQRTEEQAAGLEQTSASMEQIASTVRKNAENAQAANQSASNAGEVADRGGKVATEAVQAMARIEESSGKISDIIGVIDEIARQTNLLALNAAVEAARAGEAGRGFAVVASEVRSLAQRSSQAAKDIKDIILASGGQVKEGVELVNRAGGSLNEIVASIRHVAAIVADIASASAEQSIGVTEVNKALQQMDEATQKNSALVEQNAATAKTLEAQAQAMNEQVSYFRVDAAAAPAAPRATAKPSATTRIASRPAPRVRGALALKSDPEWEEF